jgi:V/A-type H+/Na+-transporting ATPase subunit A
VDTRESMPEPEARRAPVVGVKESLVTVDVSRTTIRKNEVLKAEVLRIRGRTADMQVFEDTNGVRVGDRVEMTGEMLSATLGPGLLGCVFDGLQNPLAALAEQHGFSCPAASRRRRWIPIASGVHPAVAVGSRGPRRCLGVVPEGPFSHKIMVPFGESEPVTVTWIGEGQPPVDQRARGPLRRARAENGK